MAKVRLHEASKKYGIANKDLAELLNNLGHKIKSHPFTALSVEMLEALENHFSSIAEGAKPSSKNKAKKNIETKPDKNNLEPSKAEPEKKQEKERSKNTEAKKHDKKKSAQRKIEASDDEVVEVNKQITIIKTTQKKEVAAPKKKKLSKAKDKRVHYSKKVQTELSKKEEKLGVVIDEQKSTVTVEQQEPLEHISVPQDITVSQLARYLDTEAVKIIKTLFSIGVVASLNQRLEMDHIQLIGQEFGKDISFKDDVIQFDDPVDAEQDLKPRPPVVTIMGHVDHGKTSLIDYIRKAHVAQKEFGGITQHIGAYQVKVNDNFITFIDTPGHEAFTAMRAQGALVTDIVILIVAADDGVQPQTIEAVHHAQAAGIPIIVAINKMDKPEANPDKVKQQLMPFNLVADDWGGDVTMVPISAKTGMGVSDLLEMVLLQAEMAEFKANPDRAAIGTIIEARLDRGMGPIATVLIQKGRIRTGDDIICGNTYGRVKALINDSGKRIKQAGPSYPAAILGLSEIPRVGDKLAVVESAKFARYVGQLRMKKEREERLSRENRLKLADLFKQVTEGKVKDLNIIIKADVQGSAGAIKDALERLSTEEVKINVIHSGVGAITEADVNLASASNAIIIGFHVRPVGSASEMAKSEKVEIKSFKIIYDAIEAVKLALKGLYDPEFEEETIGRAEVRKVYKISGVGAICGSYVLDGIIARNSSARIIRDGVEIYEGKICSLKRFKDDIREVHSGYECGIGIENYNDIKEGDILEAFKIKEVEREI